MSVHDGPLAPIYQGVADAETAIARAETERDERLRRMEADRDYHLRPDIEEAYRMAVAFHRHRRGLFMGRA